MDRIVYTAMGGAARILEQQATLSNNMANVGTAGFREQMAIYRSVPLVSEQGSLTRVTTVASTPGSNFAQGTMAETGRPLDVAITGEGWFSVQTPNGEAYTRAGEFGVSPQGLLITAQGGLPVLSVNGTPVAIPDRGSVTFSTDGSVTALGAGDNPKEIQVVAQLKLVNPKAAAMVRGDDGLFRVNEEIEPPPRPDPAVRLISGFVEKSNVSAAETMVGMIANARRFEMQMKVIQDSSTNEERANSILSSNG